MEGPVPDYYATLGVGSTATSDQIRQAYKRESLRSHPDRHPNASASERSRLTSRFQSLADAYYVLSDTARRAEYDALRRSSGFYASSSSTPPGGYTDDPEKEQQNSYNFFKNFFSGASGGMGTSQDSTDAQGLGTQPQANNVFSDVFEELLRPEVDRVLPIWQGVGGISGAGLGFLIANFPGLVAGFAGGLFLGKIRDRRGKAVGQVFMELSTSQRAEVLKALAMKVLGALG